VKIYNLGEHFLFMLMREKLLWGVVVFLVCMLALVQGISVLNHAPVYSAYCNDTIVIDSENRWSGCIVSDDLMRRAALCEDIRGDFRYEYDSNGCPVSGVCDGCRIDYERAVDAYRADVFLICLVVAVIVFVAGIILWPYGSFGVALFVSALGVFMYGVVQHWRNIGYAWRGIYLLGLFVILGWLVYKLYRLRRHPLIQVRNWKVR
jgi:hypothetical protein